MDTNTAMATRFLVTRCLQRLSLRRLAPIRYDNQQAGGRAPGAMDTSSGGWDQKIGLVLPGGGARGAYQVGVLKAIAELLPRKAPNPFPIVSGTSAGAISAAVIAMRARQFRLAVHELERVWGNFRCEQVFRSDAPTMLKSSLHWLAALVFGGLGAENPRSLLDNQPLWGLLRRVSTENIQHSIDGQPDRARDHGCRMVPPAPSPSTRARRTACGACAPQGRPTKIMLEHLMASVAVPMIFPPVLIGQNISVTAPCQGHAVAGVAPGAERMLVIGVRSETGTVACQGEPVPPSDLRQIAGYMLDALFLDGLSADLENLVRLNLILEQVPGRRPYDSGNLRHTR